MPESQANFIWLPFGSASGAFAAHCEGRGILVRPFADGVRVTLGSSEGPLGTAQDFSTPPTSIRTS